MALPVLIRAIDLFFTILVWAIIIRVILSWIRPQSYSSWYIEAERLLYAVTEPILAPIRNLIPGGSMGVDWSPFVALLLIDFLIRPLLTQLLFSLFR